MAQLLKASMKAKLIERLFFLFNLGMAQHAIRQMTTKVRIEDEQDNEVMTLRVSDLDFITILFELRVFQPTFLPIPKQWGYKCSIDRSLLVDVERPVLLRRIWEIAERAVMHYAADMGMAIEQEKADTKWHD